jgi:pimeloyl-ACP methyl ester carboxylesterase
LKKKLNKAIQFFLSLSVFFSLLINVNVTADAYTSNVKGNDISIILDISDNLLGTSKEEFKASCLDFCKNILDKSPNNRISIITSDNTKIILNFTSDIDILNERINSITTSKITDINDSLLTIDNLFNKNSSTNTDKSIIILSNGSTNDNSFAHDKYNSYKDYTSKIYDTINNFSNKYNIYSVDCFFNSSGKDKALSQKLLKNIQPENYYETTNLKSLSFNLKKISKKIINDPPIVIIPGIMGSHLYKDSNCSLQIWDPPVNLNPLNENSIYNLGNNLKIDSNLFTKKIQNQVPLSTNEREYGAQNSYKNLVDKVCDEFPDREVYFFSYDFRKSNVSAGKQLKDFIDNTLNASKVDLICHSMGGIVASNYATLDTSKIHKVITLGTPYEGAPTLINAVLNWSILSDDWNKVDLALGACGLTKKVKSGFSGVAELYPTENYFNTVGFSSKFKDGFFRSHIAPIDYDKYSQYGNTIFGNIYDSSIAEQEGINVNGSNILSTLDNSYFAIGTGEKTISSIEFKDGNTLNSIDVNSLIYENNGDGTVPKLSSTMMGNLDNINSNNVRYFSDTTHGGLVNNSDSIKWATDILKQGTSTLGNKKATSGKPYIVMRIDSPTTTTVERNGEFLNSTNNITDYSSYGRLDRIGENGQIKMLAIDEIKNSDKKNDYKVNLTATDKGKADYSISWYDENNTLEEERDFKDVPVEKGTKISTTTDKSSPTQLLIDEDGDNNVDKIIESDKDNKNGQVLLSINDSNSDSNNSGGNSIEPTAMNTSSLEEPTTSESPNMNIVIGIALIVTISIGLIISITIINKKKKYN